MISPARIYPLYQNLAPNVVQSLPSLLQQSPALQHVMAHSPLPLGFSAQVSTPAPAFAPVPASAAVPGSYVPALIPASSFPLFASAAVQAPNAGSAASPASAAVSTQAFRSPAGYPLTLFTLSNGHRLMVEQRPTDFIAVRTFVNAGSLMENAIAPSPLYRNTGLPSGIAHLDEHAHFLATQNFPQKNTWREAANRLGVKFNASTDDAVIQHEMYFNGEDLPTALKLHAESVLRPYYNAADLQQEKHAVLNEFFFRMGETSTKMMDQLFALMFERPRRQTLGSPQDVWGTTPADMQRFHQLAYAPEHLLTLVTGNVNPQEILNQMSPDLLSNPAPRTAQTGAVPINDALRLALKPGEIKVRTVTDPQLNDERVWMGFPAPALGNYRERMAMEFLLEIFGNGAESVVKKALVDESGLATRAGMEYSPQKQTGFVNLYLGTPIGQSQKAASALLTQVAAFPQKQVSEQQVAQTRQTLMQRFNQGLENSIHASSLLGEAALNNTLPYVLNYEQLANQITPADLQAVAQKYLTPDRYVLIYGLPGARAGSPPPGEERANPFKPSATGATTLPGGAQ